MSILSPCIVQQNQVHPLCTANNGNKKLVKGVQSPVDVNRTAAMLRAGQSNMSEARLLERRLKQMDKKFCKSQLTSERHMTLEFGGSGAKEHRGTLQKKKHLLVQRRHSLPLPIITLSPPPPDEDASGSLLEAIMDLEGYNDDDADFVIPGYGGSDAGSDVGDGYDEVKSQNKLKMERHVPSQNTNVNIDDVFPAGPATNQAILADGTGGVNTPTLAAEPQGPMKQSPLASDVVSGMRSSTATLSVPQTNSGRRLRRRRSYPSTCSINPSSNSSVSLNVTGKKCQTTSSSSEATCNSDHKVPIATSLLRPQSPSDINVERPQGRLSSKPQDVPHNSKHVHDKRIRTASHAQTASSEKCFRTRGNLPRSMKDLSLHSSSASSHYRPVSPLPKSGTSYPMNATKPSNPRPLSAASVGTTSRFHFQDAVTSEASLRRRRPSSTTTTSIGATSSSRIYFQDNMTSEELLHRQHRPSSATSAATSSRLHLKNVMISEALLRRQRRRRRINSLPTFGFSVGTTNGKPSGHQYEFDVMEETPSIEQQFLEIKECRYLRIPGEGNADITDD